MAGWWGKGMRTIDLHTWSRKKHFEIYRVFDYPHFGLCANVEITAFYPAVKACEGNFNIAVIYVLARIANAMTEFRYRIREDQVVEHEVIHPSTTVLGDGDLFSFCTFPYTTRFADFAPRASRAIAAAKESIKLEDEPGQDDLIFMTGIPWVSFSGLLHPIHMHPADSVPRIAWGKYFTDGERLMLPLAVQVHHALMDGLHVGRYYQQVQALFDKPEFLREISL